MRHAAIIYFIALLASIWCAYSRAQGFGKHYVVSLAINSGIYKLCEYKLKDKTFCFGASSVLTFIGATWFEGAQNDTNDMANDLGATAAAIGTLGLAIQIGF